MRTLAGAVFCAIVIATGPLARAEALAPGKPEEVGLSSERLARIGKVFGQEIDQGRLPGVVVAIARKGKLAYYESFGFREGRGRADAEGRDLPHLLDDQAARLGRGRDADGGGPAAADRPGRQVAAGG